MPLSWQHVRPSSSNSCCCRPHGASTTTSRRCELGARRAGYLIWKMWMQMHPPKRPPPPLIYWHQCNVVWLPFVKRQTPGFRKFLMEPLKKAMQARDEAVKGQQHSAQEGARTRAKSDASVEEAPRPLRRRLRGDAEPSRGHHRHSKCEAGRGNGSAIPCMDHARPQG